MKNILAQVISVKTKRVIREFYYDKNGNDLNSVLSKVRMYVLEEGVNSTESVTVQVREI